MLKGWIHIAFILLILLNGMGYTLIQLHFYLDRDEITALYCINKEKPELECNGKCELGKRLSDAQTQNKNQADITLEELTMVFTLDVLQENTLTETALLESNPNSFYRTPSCKTISSGFFHPPKI